MIRRRSERPVPRSFHQRARVEWTSLVVRKSKRPSDRRDLARRDLVRPLPGAITAMTMMDEEGELSTPNVNARFVDGDPVGLVVRYEMTTPAAFDRFIRFMGRYAEANGLNFNKA